ncbi:MAG: PH domain-containing protein [Bacilli bacterium]|nr:PH domain-containing protein [Bacilli bacterium]
MGVYNIVKDFKKKYPGTVAFRLKKHADVVEKHLNPNERVLFAFCGQKNVPSLMFVNSCVVALTNKRIMIGQKRLFWGYFFTAVTPDMYNDLKVRKGLIWSDVEIDTIKENIYISNLSPEGAIAIETSITEFMMKEKKKYAKKTK